MTIDAAATEMAETCNEEVETMVDGDVTDLRQEMRRGADHHLRQMTAIWNVRPRRDLERKNLVIRRDGMGLVEVQSHRPQEPHDHREEGIVEGNTTSIKRLIFMLYLSQN